MNVSDLKKQYVGQNLILCGAGPSLHKYCGNPFDGIHIALNRTFLKDDIDFDAVICADYTAVCGTEKSFLEKKKLKKVLCRIPGPEESVIPASFFEMEHVISCEISDLLDTVSFDGSFTKNVDSEPLRFFRSIATTAVQLLLYCKPKKIYLVGMDFSMDGHFDDAQRSKELRRKHADWSKSYWETAQIREIWMKLARFAKENYPEVQLISVNPVALKGIFTDIYCNGTLPAVTAYIPVKAHSVRLPGKNMLPFGDSNLLVHKIRQLKRVRSISRIIVSSDSRAMLDMAEEEGVCGIERPKELADESRPYAEFVDYLARTLPGEHIMRCPVTAPLCDADVLADSIEQYFEALQQGYDSLTSVLRFQHHILDEKGPLNFTTGLDHKGSQNLPVWYEIANCMDIEPKEIMAKHLFQYGPKVFRYEVDRITATDIDDEMDYRIACAIYQYEKAER